LKGVELPINTIVILVIALIILLAIIALFFGIWTPGVGGVSLEAAKDNACLLLTSTGCGDTSSIIVKDFDADKDGNLNEANSNTGNCGSDDAGDNLFMLCKCHYNKDESECRTDVCNCP